MNILPPRGSDTDKQNSSTLLAGVCLSLSHLAAIHRTNDKVLYSFSNFFQAFDRHVTWCMEKSRRMQTSPKKDLEALAKLQTRISYRPNTPSRKESTGSGGSPSRKASNTSVESMTSPNNQNIDLMTRSLSRTDSECGFRRKSYSGTKSLGRSSGISFLKSAEHTKETQDTHFIRNSTGRGSIKRGPAATRASILRQAKQAAEGVKNDSRATTPNCPLHSRGASMTPTLRRRAPSPSGSLYGYAMPQRNNSSNYGGNDYSFNALVKPSVVRPSR